MSPPEGLESSPVVDALAGLRANEARVLQEQSTTTSSRSSGQKMPRMRSTTWRNILKSERDLVIESEPLEATQFTVDGIRWTHVFYEDGLSINVLYTFEDGGKGQLIKLSDGRFPPNSHRSSGLHARSPLAGTIRGSCLAIKGEY